VCFMVIDLSFAATLHGNHRRRCGLSSNARKHKRYKDQIIDELQNIEHKGKTFQVEKAIYESVWLGH